MAKLQRDCNVAFIAPCRQQFVPFLVQSVTLGGQIVFLPLSPYFYCLSSSSSAHYGLLLSPATLISRLLLRMRRIYVCSIRLDFHQDTKNDWNVHNATRNLITCVLTTSHVKLNQSTALEQKRFDLRS